MEKLKLLLSGAVGSFTALSVPIDSVFTQAGPPEGSFFTHELVKTLLAIIVSFLTQLIHKKYESRKKDKSK